MATIKITVPRNPKGKTKVEVEGFAGPGCEDLTANIQAALGTTVESEHTDEYYQAHNDNDQTLQNFG